MPKIIKKVGVLTSGGDSPGMNAAIRSVVRTCAFHNIECIGIYRGYQGMIEGDFKEMGPRSVNNIVNKGGTILKSARSSEFKTLEGRKKAHENLVKAGVDALVVIGGDGTFTGGLLFSTEFNFPIMGIPGTIDNDIACTEYTIGFDTAMNTVIECVDKLDDTCKSHERCSVVEVMGRHAGHVALNTGIATGAIGIITEEIPNSIEDIARHIFKAREIGKEHFVVIVSEGYGKPHEIAEKIEAMTGVESRATVLGHIQRGGAPTLKDRVVATQMGHRAVELLEQGIGDRVIAQRSDCIVDLDLEEALAMKKDLDRNLYHIMLDTSF